MTVRRREKNNFEQSLAKVKAVQERFGIEFFQGTSPSIELGARLYTCGRAL